MISDNDLLVKTIAFLRFPLIVLIVFMHVNPAGTVINGSSAVMPDTFPVYNLVHHLLSIEIAHIAVPLFFFISGFLFFYKTDFSLHEYKRKLLKRARTLLIPYLFWNVCVLLLKIGTETLLPSMLSGNNAPLSGYGLKEWLNVFWDYNNGEPICYQFWFIRDLMVVVLFSPLIFYIVRYGRWLAIALLGVLWMFDIWFDCVITIAAFFFFSCGAWFSLNGKNFVTIFSRILLPSMLLYILFISINTTLWYLYGEVPQYADYIARLAGILTVVSLTAYGFRKGALEVKAGLAGSAFFIYAYHGMPVSLLTKLWLKVAPPTSEWEMLAGYFLIAGIIIGVGIGLYRVSMRCFPRFTSLISGGR